MSSSSGPVKLYIVYYSTWLHVHELALAIQRGAQKVPGLEIKLFQMAETLPDAALEKMYAPAKPDVPVLQPNDIAEADGFLFGIPTRYGNMPTQVKAFWDATGSLWQKGALVGKMAGTFFSTSSQHGGQETTAFTFLTTLAHHGMIYVPLGYSTPLLLDNELPNGGSAYGAGTLSNPDGSRAVSDHEKSIGEFQGESFAKILKAYVDGRRGSCQVTDGMEEMNGERLKCM
ncbi:MAG: NAD(P)H:quinone oxidoreductase, type IV [Piptocephalis tieghemiana]|nr:MAG: NAD(P)H:quinone oxidoreductase, type IV [Piptocephalis tieghemiana]